MKQDNNFNDNKLTKLDSVIVNRNPTSDHELATIKYVDDSIGAGNVLRINQTLENLKVSVGDDVYNLTKYEKTQITDKTIITNPKIGKDLLQRWNIISNDENNNSQPSNFIKSTRTSNPTSDSGANSLSVVGNAFMFIETSYNNHTISAYVILERTDIFQISNIKF